MGVRGFLLACAVGYNLLDVCHLAMGLAQPPVIAGSQLMFE